MSAFARPKRGEPESEDAWAADPATGRYAVADGATESSFAGAWAKLLCDDFAAGGEPAERLVELRARWFAEFGTRPVPWYAEAKRDQGAFAAFVGLHLSDTQFRVIAVGDCCVLRINDVGLTSFPLTNADDFDDAPALVGSRYGTPAWVEWAGERTPSETWLLCSDALACWALRHGPALLQFADDVAFGDFIDAERAAGRLKNDDVTLLVVSP